MSSLQTYHVEDWSEFIQENDIDLRCPHCKDKDMPEECDQCSGSGYMEMDMPEECDQCSGSGYMEIIWNTIWNTGFHSTHLGTPAEVGSVAIFEYDDTVWFGLQGCGMDMAPYLAAAWMKAFPDCDWLPEQFMVTGVNLRGGYIESCVGKTTAKKIHALMGKTIKGMRHQAAYLAADLKEARANLAKKK